MATTTGGTSSQGQNPVVGASDLVAQAERHWNVTGTAVLVAWGVALTGGFAIVLFYSWIRASSNSSSFELIYESRIKYCQELNKEPQEGVFAPTIPERRAGFFGWLAPALKDYWKEAKNLWPGSRVVEERNLGMLRDLGLDATIFLRCLAMLRWMFLSISIFVGIPSLCANYYINTAFAESLSDRSAPLGGDVLNTTELDLLLFTAANASGNAMSAHVIFECVTTCLVILFMWKHMSEYRRLLQAWYIMNASEVSFKTILLTDLAITELRDGLPKTVYEAKAEICGKLESSGLPPYSSGDVEVEMTHKSMKHIAEMIKRYKDSAFKHFDRAMTVWLRQRSSGDADHVRGIWDRINYPAWTEKQREEILKRGVTEAIDEALVLKTHIEEAQKQVRGSVDEFEKPKHRRTVEQWTYLESDVNTAFVTVPTVLLAQDIIQKANIRRDPDDKVYKAPRSDNILWVNFDLDRAEQKAKALTAKLALILICFINTIPLLIITFLTNLDTAIEKVPAFRSLAESSDTWKGIFTIGAGLAPALVAALFSYVLPYIMRFLSQWSGALSTGQLDKDVIKQLFFFLVFWQFLIFSLMGILYEAYLTVKDQVGVEDWVTIYDSLGDVPTKISKAYISNSSYWLSWYPIRSLVAWVTLLQIPRTLLKFWQVWIKHLFVTYEQSHRDIKDIAQPEPFEYAINFSHILFGVCIGLAYAPLAPLVPICCTVYLWVRSITCLNQLTFVEKIEESDGAAWKVVMYRLLASLSMMIVFTGLAIALKTRSAALSATAFVPLLGPAYLAHLLRTGYKPENIIEILREIDTKDNPLFTGGALTVFRHALLDPNWAPIFLHPKRQAGKVAEARQEFGGLSDLLRPQTRPKREKKRGRRRRREASGGGRRRWKKDR